MSQPTSSRRRRSVVLAGVLGTAVFAVTAGLSLGGFSAGINNTNNNFSSGTVVLRETAGATNCYSSGVGPGTITVANTQNCTTIDDLGGAVNQGPASAVQTQNLTLTNLGTINGSTFTVTPGACTAVAAGGTGGWSGADTAGFCGKVDVSIFNTTSGNCVYPAGAGACPALANTKTLATLGTAGALSLGALNAGASDALVVSTQLDSTASNSDQGLTAGMAFNWVLNQ
jgi:hypothetical protein